MGFVQVENASGHFRTAVCLVFKARPEAQTFGHHLFPSLKLTTPFLFNLYDVQSTLDFKSTSTKQRF